jgi:hypothetical protein
MSDRPSRSWTEGRTGEEADPATGGPLVILHHTSLERLRPEIENTARRWMEPSACCAAVMPRISFSWRYTLPTPSVEGSGKVSRSVAVAATFWLALVKVGHGAPSRLMVVATSLALAWAEVMSTN